MVQIWRGSEQVQLYHHPPTMCISDYIFTTELKPQMATCSFVLYQVQLVVEIRTEKHWPKFKRLNPILVTLSLLYTETLQGIRHPILKTTDRQWEYSWPGTAIPRIRSGTFLRLVELEFLLVVPSQCRFVLSVRLHTKLTPEALHIVCKHTHTVFICQGAMQMSEIVTFTN